MATKSRALSFMTLLAALQVLSLASARLGVSEDGHMRALYEDDAAVRFLPLQVIGTARALRLLLISHVVYDFGSRRVESFDICVVGAQQIFQSRTRNEPSQLRTEKESR